MSDDQQLGIVLEQEAIRDVLARYFLAVGDGDWAAVEACFAPAARVDYGFEGEQTLAAQLGFLRAGIERFESSTLMMSNSVVSVAGEEASSQVMALTAHQAPEASGDRTRLSVVRYEDRWRREPQGWRISDRRIRTLWRAWLDPRRDDQAGDHRNARDWLGPR